MTWTVETLGAVVDAEIAALPKDMQASFLRLAERIEAVGLERIGEPHVKHLQDKLWGDAVWRARRDRQSHLRHRGRPSSGRGACLCEEDPENAARHP